MLKTGLVTVVVASAVTITGAWQQTRTPQFKSGVEAVVVDALVTKNGKALAGLTTDDFEVRDNGVLQTVQVLEPTDVTLNAVLALDTSQSTAGKRLTDLEAAGRALLDDLKPGDKVALTTFNQLVAPRVSLTPKLDDVRAALGSITASGDTALMDGIFVALMTVQGELGRSLVLVCTDGGDTASWLQPDEVLDVAKRSNAVIYGILTSSTHRRTALHDLADATGGTTIELGFTTDLKAQFTAILKEFRSRYLLTYVPKGVSATGWHKLEVRVHRSDVAVKARPGYFPAGIQ
jgi:Ca-activated chloride channel family protein